MPLKHVHAQIETEQSIATIWERVSNPMTWTDWGPYDETERLRDGTNHPDGVGSVRRLKKGNTEVTEEITGFDPPRYVRYILLSGLPLRDYVGEISLTTTGTGTHIRWKSSFRGPFGIGWLYALALKRFLKQLLRDLATV
jgi:hypothetical protein